MGSKRTEVRKEYRKKWAEEGARIKAENPERFVLEIDPTIAAKKARRNKPVEGKDSIRKSIHRILMPAHLGANKPMQCRMLGCNKRLGYRQLDICCSENCKEQLRKICETYLAVIEGILPADQFPWELRRRGSARFVRMEELDPQQQERDKRETKAASDRRLRQERNPTRWIGDLRQLRETTSRNERVATEDDGEARPAAE